MPTSVLGSYGDAEGICGQELRGALLVEHVDLGDLEAGIGQQVGDRSGEVTPTEEALLHRFEPVLPSLHLLVGRQPVLDEVQCSTGLEDTTYLS